MDSFSLLQTLLLAVTLPVLAAILTALSLDHEPDPRPSERDEV